MSSTNPEDQLLMAREEIALKNLRKLEVISALARRKQLPSGFELCMCDAVQVRSILISSFSLLYTTKVHTDLILDLLDDCHCVSCLQIHILSIFGLQ